MATMPDMSRNIAITLESLKANHFDAQFAQTVAEAKRMILEMIPLAAVVGIGDSATVRQIGVLDELTQRRCEVINPFTRQLTENMGKDPARRRLFLETARRTLGTDVFLTSANAVTEDGKIVSTDRVGNRVAGVIFGAPKVILPVGRNKIVKDVDEALYRIKNVIAPVHAERKGRRTPCAVTGKCSDCDSSERICSVTIILEKRLLYTDLSIVLINEDLGLGWDPAWDSKHISEIRASYSQNTWAFFFPK